MHTSPSRVSDDQGWCMTHVIDCSSSYNESPSCLRCHPEGISDHRHWDKQRVCTCGIEHIVCGACSLHHEVNNVQPQGVARGAGHHSVDQRLVVVLFCLEHQVMALQECIHWPVAFLYGTPSKLAEVSGCRY